MAYEQYSTQAYTGDVESAKNRIPSNSHATTPDQVLWPDRLDVFTNKENTSLADYAVTENHGLGELDGSTLYLHHRPATNSQGGFLDITPSDGAIDTGSTDLFQKSVQFSTLPTNSSFNISYTARGDKIEDTHINSMQNAIMAMQTVLGLKSPGSEVGTGLISLPIVTTMDIATLTELQTLQGFLPGVVLTKHLQEDFYLTSTNDPDLPAQNITVWLGNTGTVSRDQAVFDFDRIQVQATNTLNPDGLPSGQYIYSSNTGDFVGFSGCVEFASQMTVGMPYGTCIDPLQFTVPEEAGAFYSGAAIRAHGGIWFGSGLSGNGDVTFMTTTGEAVTVQGSFIATTLTVNDQAAFNGVSRFNNAVEIMHPGYLTTNNDITMGNKPNGQPTKIDGLDPSYAKAVLDHTPVIKSSLTQSVRHDISEQHQTPYVSATKHHPQHGFDMYPIMGGWTFTGKVNFEKAQSGQHHNVMLLESAMTAIGDNYPTVGGKSLGGGTPSYGSYCTGLFNPGDTYIEFDIPLGNQNRFSYPIYHHTAEQLLSSKLTGVNVYVAADDNAFEDGTTLAGQWYRIYQPGNVPLDHLKADADSSFLSATAPAVRLGNSNNADYPGADIKFVTDSPWDGGSAVGDQRPLHKKLSAGNIVSVDITDALTKSLDNETPGASDPKTGIAYVYATSRPGNNSTQEDSVQLRATPTPYGLASQYVWHDGYDMKPGQHCPGTNWTLLDTAPYRPDGFYDSGWVPMVEYRSALSNVTSIVSDFGRCLPILGSRAGTEYVATEEDFNFWVEHNLGPVRGGLVGIECKVWVASYKTDTVGSPQVSHVTGETIYKRTSAGDLNLWTPVAEPYLVGHDNYAATAGDRGYLSDISNLVSVRMVDSRFAMLSIDTPTAIESHQYIRVYINRTR